MLRLFAFLAAVFCFSTAHASEKPLEITSYIKSEKAYGAGKYSWLAWDAYEAELWTDKSWSYQNPFALSIKYDMDFSSDDLISQTIKEMKGQGIKDENLLTKYKSDLATLFPSVKENDRITATYSPSGEIAFYHNGKKTGLVKNKEFAQNFFNIWLGEKTSDPKLRKKLLNQ